VLPLGLACRACRLIRFGRAMIFTLHPVIPAVCVYLASAGEKEPAGKLHRRKNSGRRFVGAGGGGDGVALVEPRAALADNLATNHVAFSCADGRRFLDLGGALMRAMDFHFAVWCS